MSVLGCGYLLVCLGLAKLYVSPPRAKPPALRLFKRTLLDDKEPVWVSPGLLAGKPKGNTLYVMVHGYGGGVGHWSELGNELVAKGYNLVSVGYASKIMVKAAGELLGQVFPQPAAG